MRINAAARPRGALVQPVRRRAAQGRDPARPEGARGYRGERSRGVRQDRRAGEGRARKSLTELRRSSAARRSISRLSAHLSTHDWPGAARPSRSLDDLIDELRWDVPLRLFGGVHYLELSAEPYALSGEWEDFRRALGGSTGVPRRFIQEQASRRTRCSAASACCRRSSRRPGMGRRRSTCSSSARPPGSTCSGIATRSATGRAWGSSSSTLRGVETCRRRSEVLETQVEVRSRHGIDGARST